MVQYKTYKFVVMAAVYDLLFGADPPRFIFLRSWHSLSWPWNCTPFRESVCLLPLWL